MLFSFLYYVQVSGEPDWLARYGSLILAILAIFGTGVTGYWGWQQKKTPTGEAKLDDERQYRLELRTENRDLKAELAEVEKLNDNLSSLNRELRKENQSLRGIKEGLDVHLKILVDEKAQRDAEVLELKENVVRLSRQVTRLEVQAGDGGK